MKLNLKRRTTRMKRVELIQERLELDLEDEFQKVLLRRELLLGRLGFFAPNCGALHVVFPPLVEIEKTKKCRETLAWLPCLRELKPGVPSQLPPRGLLVGVCWLVLKTFDHLHL